MSDGRLLGNPLLGDNGADFSTDSAKPIRRYRIATAILATLTLLFLILFAVEVHKNKSNNDNKPNDSGVLPDEVQSYILSAMDRTADPCNDWYKYACNGYIQQNPLVPANTNSSNYLSFGQAETTTHEQFQKILDDQFQPAGDFLKACKDLNSIQNDETNLKYLINWLQFVDSINELNSTDFWYKVGVLNGHQLTSNYPYSFTKTNLYFVPDPDFPDAPNPYNVPTADPNMKLELQAQMILALEPNQVDLFGTVRSNVGELVTSVTQLQQLLAAQGYNLFDAKVYTAASVVQMILDLTAKFYNDPNGLISNNPFIATNFTTLENISLPALLTGFGDHSYAYQLANVTDTEPSHSGFADHLTHVGVLNATYFKMVNDYVEQQFATCVETRKTSPSQACTGVDALKFMLKSTISLAMQNVTTLNTINDLKVQQQYCMGVFEQNFNNVFLNEWFVESFAPGTKAAVTEVVELIYQELGRTIAANPWLDQETRTKALNKWQLITKNIIYDASWDNDMLGLVIVGKPGLDLVASNSYAIQRLLLTLDVPGDIHSPERAGMTPDVQNAFYMPTDNSINMIPGLMQFPMFDPKLPMQLNIAKYGWVIGHELTHGFDNSGRQFDGVGSHRNWWSQHSLDQFLAKSQCFVDQYWNETIWGIKVNGTLSLGENIADNGGIGLAWRTYRSVQAASPTPDVEMLPGFSNDKLFWVWAAQTWCATTSYNTVYHQLYLRDDGPDVHSPFPVRGHAPMKNMPEFAQTFQCAATTDMGSSLTDKRCHLW